MDRILEIYASLCVLQATIEALLDPAVSIAHLSRDHVLLYQNLLALKQRSLGGEMQLSAEDVQNVVDAANQVSGVIRRRPLVIIASVVKMQNREYIRQ